ncbi:hypothetical protein [Kitasatospora sp. MBT66]|uniref:hypothetical protein n=1 Tax=Kitasatospora sp. MBT66 TaxID=1444769 RepID=UPI0005BDEC06|nr:hypothetical protein [Kitasatospora sp. MBT66]
MAVNLRKGRHDYRLEMMGCKVVDIYTYGMGAYTETRLSGQTEAVREFFRYWEAKAVMEMFVTMDTYGDIREITEYTD